MHKQFQKSLKLLVFLKFFRKIINFINNKYQFFSFLKPCDYIQNLLSNGLNITIIKILFFFALDLFRIKEIMKLIISNELMKKAFKRIKAHCIILMKAELLRRVINWIVCKALIKKSSLTLTGVSANVEHRTFITLFINNVLLDEIIDFIFFLLSAYYLVLICTVYSQYLLVKF